MPDPTPHPCDAARPHAVRRPARAVRPHAVRRVVATAVALVVCALAAAGCGGAEARSDAAGAASLTGVAHQPYTVDAADLTDTDGAPYSLGDTGRPLTLVFFGYTHCPDICGLVMSSLTSGLARLDPADRADVDVVFVTTDPSRDTGRVLRRYLDRYDPSYVGLTGDIATIAAVGDSLAVYVDQGQQLPSGGFDLGAHSTQVSALGPDGTSPLLWTQDTTSAQYAEDIHTLLQQGL